MSLITPPVLSSSEAAIYRNGDSGFVLKTASGVSSTSPCEDDWRDFTDMLRTLAHDKVLLLSILHGVPAEEQDTLAELLEHVLWVASEVAPVEASQILSTLLLLEFYHASQKRNDVHTFMRGNGVVPKVFEGLLARVVSSEGGIEGQLLRCCSILHADGAAPAVAEGDVSLSEADTDTVRSGEVVSSRCLLEGLDYFNGSTTLLSGVDKGIARHQDSYVSTIGGMSCRILNVVYASVSQWPWSLRESLRCLLNTVGAASQDHVQPGHRGCSLETLTILQQNMMATIVVLRAVVPTLINIVSRLLPEESCFDTHYTLVQKRCTMLAKLAQKAAHGLLFSGPHETEMAAFNNELPALTQRWAEVFLYLCHKTDPPSPRHDGDLVASEAEAGLRFCEFLDHYFVRLLHWVMQHKPIMEPIYWSRLLCLTRYAQRRLGRVGHFASVPLPSSVTFPVVGEGSVFSRMLRPVLGFLSRVGRSRHPSGAQTASRNAVSSPAEVIFDELVAYALGMIDDPGATGVHACFCGIFGLACDGTVGIFIYWDLLRLYLEEYQARKGVELQRRCPRFCGHWKDSVLQFGDSLAYLFVFISLALSSKDNKGFRLFVLAAKPSMCCSWLGDALRLLPTRYARQCAHVLLLNPADVHLLHTHRVRHFFELTVCRRARDLLRTLEELRLHLPLRCMEYHTLLVTEAGESDQTFRLLFPPPPCVEPNGVGQNGFVTSAASVLHASLEAHLWPLSLMWDVFTLIQSAIAPPEVLSLSAMTSGVENGAGMRPLPKLPKYSLSLWRMHAVKFFFNFEGDLLLHLEIEPKWLRETSSPGHDTAQPPLRASQQKEDRYCCSWFSLSHAGETEEEMSESCLLRVLFLASRRCCAGGGLQLTDRSSEVGLWPSIVPSLRHTTLESLWRLLLYSLWNTFALVRHVSPARCPVTRVTQAVRAYLGRSPQPAPIADNLHLFDDDTALLNMAATALLAAPAAECGILQLLVEICAFIRKIDLAELDSAAVKHDGAKAAWGNVMTDGVIRIVFRKEELDDAELLGAHLIATQGAALLLSACVSPPTGGVFT
ncbi:uncharacterized protein Tco025E_04817 [Trypanosoma conorhini]|uniref:Ras-GAP domain-containing protein n=1 Tax=Trypanosoma conorhini TaxID=83891 RepID=A0A422PIG2_9TRYP|nr:uncharacterized protein Tco025E_04817 [Trypanosoma conorhini]RNF17486.1 hypothetical protein Tco025E_04817 [Trypanosoma conorhini]